MAKKLIKAENFEKVLRRYEPMFVREQRNARTDYIRAQVHPRVVNLVRAHGTELHVDIGSGFGQILGDLKSAIPEAQILGVDRTRAMNEEAEQNLHTRGFPATMFGSRRVHITKEGFAAVHYERCPADHRKEKNSPGIALVLDDIRSARVLKFVVGDRLVTSGSLIVPNVPYTMAWEAPYLVEDLSEQEQWQRFHEILDATRLATYRWMSEHIKAGGRFYTVERMASTLVGAQILDPQILVDKLRKSLQAFARYWDMGDLQILTNEENSREIGYMHLRAVRLDETFNPQHAEVPAQAPMVIYIQEMIRKKTAFALE